MTNCEGGFSAGSFQIQKVLISYFISMFEVNFQQRTKKFLNKFKEIPRTICLTSFINVCTNTC